MAVTNQFEYNRDIYGVAYGGAAGQEKFVAVGQNGLMAYLFSE